MVKNGGSYWFKGLFNDEDAERESKNAEKLHL